MSADRVAGSEVFGLTLTCCHNAVIQALPQHCYGKATQVEPTRALPIIALVSLVAVESGGWSLLTYLTGREGLSRQGEQFFRAGHAHAGVLLVLSLAYFIYLGRTGFSTTTQWALGAVLLVGILAQSGGFFVHLLLGAEREPSIGTVVTRVGGVLLAFALLALAVGLARASE